MLSFRSRPLTLSFALSLAVGLIAATPARAGDDHEDGEQPEVDQPTVVELVISASANEEPTLDNPLGPTRRNFRGRLEQIRAIAADPEVDGVALKINGIPGMAKTIDLLDELRDLKASGKKIVCYTETLTRSDAMIASMADLLVVPPSGMIALEGMLAESMYMKDLFAKLDVRFEVLHIGDFKTAYEDFAKDEMSAGQRATLESILNEYYGQIVDTIALNRGLTTEQVEEYFTGMFVDPKVAAETGLIDKVAYHDEFDDAVTELFGGEVDVVKNYGDRSKEDIEKMLDNPFAAFALLGTLLNPPKAEVPDEPYVAIVYASGAIMSGKSQSDFQGNVSTMGSDTIVDALEETLKDDNCKSVVLRVNSPGGSALASDMIYRAVQRVRASGRPVVSSMGSVAASGGYWISMGCDAIVAQPSTITGSIGVVSMIPDLSQAVKELGINVQTVSAGPMGDQMSLLKHGPTPVVKETIVRWMGEVYEDFVAKVSDGRKLPTERVHELAKGRAWTGREAEAVGLVDELGGLQEAIDLAAALGGVSDPPLVELPNVPNFLEQLEEDMGGLAKVQTPVEMLVEQLGFGELMSTARRAMDDPKIFSADRVQAVLPFQMVVR